MLIMFCFLSYTEVHYLSKFYFVPFHLWRKHIGRSLQTMTVSPRHLQKLRPRGLNSQSPCFKPGFIDIFWPSHHHHSLQKYFEYFSVSLFWQLLHLTVISLSCRPAVMRWSVSVTGTTRGRTAVSLTPSLSQQSSRAQRRKVHSAPQLAHVSLLSASHIPLIVSNPSSP